MLEVLVREIRRFTFCVIVDIKIIFLVDSITFVKAYQNTVSDLLYYTVYKPQSTSTCIGLYVKHTCFCYISFSVYLFLI